MAWPTTKRPEGKAQPARGGSLPALRHGGQAGASGEKGAGDRLAETLVGQGLVKEEDLRRAVALQRKQGGSLSQLLVDLRLVGSKALAAALSRMLHIPTISLGKMELDPELAKLISRKLALHYQIVPVSHLGRQLAVAMADPLNILALDHLAEATGLSLAAFVSTAEEVQEALHRLYGGGIADTLAELKEKSEAVGDFELLTQTPGDRKAEPLEELIRLTQEGPVVRITNAILAEGVKRRASDILVEPFERALRIRYRVDGVFTEGQSPPAAMHSGIVSRIKVMSDLNIAEHRLPQDGRIKFSVEGRDVDFRVSVLPSYYGEKVCLRILDKAEAKLDIDQLGFNPQPLQALKEAVLRPHGMVLITGPTGSGKTTTLYSLLKQVDDPAKNLVTVEDPVEFDLPGINQVAVHPEIGLTFAAGLRSILRQDPNVIMVGEIRDAETADIAVKAALTGHLVLSTLHTNDALGAVSRLTNMGVEPFLVAASVLLLGAQRLPRRVCAGCKQPASPSEELVRQMGLRKTSGYMRGAGCARCHRSGLLGRVGLLEAVAMIPPIRRAVEEGASVVRLRELALENGFPSLRNHAIAQAEAGVIPLEEVVRTTVGYQE